MHRVTLQSGREKSLRQKHPWVFSGAIAAVEGAPAAGETVAICSADGAFLASAAWSPASAIRARVWSFDARQAIDDAFIAGRVRAAAAARAPMLDATHTGCRLVHAESDGLPGVDRRPLRRGRGHAVAQRRRRGLARQYRQRARGSDGLRGRLRTLRRGGASARRPAHTHRHRGRHPARPRDPAGGWPALRHRCRRRPEDRIFSRPATEPTSHPRARRGARGAGLLLLHRRLYRRRAGRRRTLGARNRQLGRRADAGPPQRCAERNR